MSQQNEYLYEKTIQYIVKIIEKNLGNPNFKLPTEAEISAALGVSRMTVTTAFKAINKTGAVIRIKSKGTFISPTATLKTLEPLLSSQSAPSSTKLIGVLLPSSISSHTLNILSGIISSANNCQYIVADTEMSQELEKRHIQDMLAKNIDGLILYPVDNDHYNNSLLNLALKKFPVILTDRDLPGLNFTCVTSDNKDMVEKSIEHLIANGNKDILFFSANQFTPSSIKKRREHYIETLQKHNILTQYLFNANGDDEASQREFQEYLATHPAISAILATDYTSGFCLKKMLEQLNIRTPQDMEVIYIDIQANNYSSNFTSIPTHISQNSFEIGKLAIQTLLEQLDNPQMIRQKLYVKANFVKGDTTK